MLHPRPDPAALDQAIRDLRQGNLAAPQQALQQTAAQLAEAARQQAQGQPDNTSPSPDSPQQQARQLQQRLQELNRKLQQLAAERTDQPDTQQQATAAMLQQLDQLAQAASQQAQTLQQLPRRTASQYPDQCLRDVLQPGAGSTAAALLYKGYASTATRTCTASKGVLNNL